MQRITPAKGIALVAVFALMVWAADLALTGGFDTEHIRVAPERDGSLSLDIHDLQPSQVRFYRFLNSGNQEVKFLVGKDEQGKVHVAFDASESDYKRKRGFRHQGEWLVNNKCDTAIRLREVSNGRGGCAPVPLVHQLAGDRVLLHETDILAGWRYFR